MKNFVIVYISLLIFIGFVVWTTQNPWWSFLLLFAPSWETECEDKEGDE